MKIDNILVATDFSESSNHAVQRAVQLAMSHGARLTVLHVLEADSLQWAGFNSDLPPADRVTALEDRLRDLVASTSLGQLHAVSPVVKQGKAFVEIIRFARDAQANLIVLGAHGQHFFRDVFLGSTTEKVVNEGDRSVLVVRKPTLGDYGRVLTAVDFSPMSASAFAQALEIAPAAKHSLLHAYQYPEPEPEKLEQIVDTDAYMKALEYKARQELDHFLEPFDLADRKVKRIVKFGYPPAVVRQVTRRRQFELAVIGATGKSGLRHILLGSTAEHALRELRCDVLVVRTGMSAFELP